MVRQMSALDTNSDTLDAKFTTDPRGEIVENAVIEFLADNRLQILPKFGTQVSGPFSRDVHTFHGVSRVDVDVFLRVACEQ
jgi:hypothetical protein